MSKRVVSLSVKQKLKIIDLVAKKVDKKEIKKKYKCDISTINKIIKLKDAIRSAAKSGNLQRKRQRKGVHAKVEEALYVWFNQQRQKDAVISSLMVLNKAKEFAVKLHDNFEPKSSWLWRWRKRYNIKFGKIHGEVSDNDKQGASYYTSTILPEIIEQYNPENIFNADETGLFYKALPNTTYFEAGNQPKGRKSQKVRITLLLLCNATGSYKKAYVIGKPKNPRCFRNKEAPVPYFANKKAWMTSDLWDQIITLLDNEMERNKKKIVLFVDNAACHKMKSQLKNIDIQFLNLNTTALIQPLGQGIIHAFKTQYKQIIVNKQLCALECNMTVQQFLRSISILDALYFVKRAWWMVKKQTIINSFKKAGFGTFSETNSELYDVGDTLLPTEFIHCDDELECYGQLTEEEIIQSVESVEEMAADMQEDEDETSDANIPTTKEAVLALNTLKCYCTENNINTDFYFDLEEKIAELTKRHLIQSKITEHFDKN